MPSSDSKKFFVLDTNVVLYDFQCIYSFKNHHVVIPITLLEELDRFKRGHEAIHYNAREFSRELDALIGDRLLHEDVPLDSGGFVRVDTNIQKDSYIKELFWEDTPDHRILSIAYNLARQHGNPRVVLVSKDINLRMKAKSIGIQSEDYETGKIQNIDDLYTGKNRIEGIEHAVIDRLFKETAVPLDETGLDILPIANENFILRNDSQSILSTWVKKENALKFVEKKRAYGITPRNAEQIFSLNALMDPRISLVSLSGKAGTGKTLMALAAALEVRKHYKQIFLARPVVPLSNRDIGYLPGDVEEKLNPYMQPLFDNLSVIQNQFAEESPEYKRIAEMMIQKKLVITALTYIRGRSLPSIYFIVDEAQNLTPHEVKTIITRAGEGTKVVFTGDPHQIDTPYLDSRSNGLTCLIDKMKGQEMYAHITLEKGERSALAEIASDLL
ncbi:PhoH family protein [Desulfosudis oleivorans]|uniref:PhoH family protein n=1 Tax=Desulfosudis oleivorans (strain DSM 6200 / JCM 39069 / Hxd3) TaxID=96561 RepID=A8ZYZ1_DESOH|nr:PhoH family protein [Desulfosudis oleivorans]ABW68764.1 PhoH family protein [Desulfosudis oleivorans Hxd3]